MSNTYIIYAENVVLTIEADKVSVDKALELGAAERCITFWKGSQLVGGFALQNIIGWVDANTIVAQKNTVVLKEQR